MKTYGIAVGDGGYGAGDLVEVTMWVQTDDGAGADSELQAKDLEGEWFKVYQVFSVEGDITLNSKETFYQ